MAVRAQNFFKHDEDTFNVVFTVTDVTADLSNYYATWIVADSSTGTKRIQKNTDPAFTGASLNVGDISITNQTITVSIDQNDYSGITAGTTYYHELTIGSLQNGNDSAVISSGDWEVLPAQFDHR